MKYTTTTLLALAAGANAHTLFSEFYVNGVGQGSGTCVRTPYNAEGAVNPIKDLSSDDMVCGQNGEAGVARTCSVTSGSSITFEYRQWPDDVSRGPLDHGHMGPCSVYLKKVGNAATDSGAGDGWFKLWDEGYDASDSGPNPWCTQRMIANEGRITVTLPESLQGGDYLVRPELLALHNAGPKGAPEFYVGCAQVFLESSGTQGPASTVSIPGHVNMSSSAVTFDVWATPMDKDYPIPGPGVASFATASTTAQTSQTDGIVTDCIATNNNWCGKELPDFSNSEDGCWAADKDCWAQVQACWDAAGAVGGVGCKIMEDKCYANQAVCKTGSSASGPANKGKFLGPEASTIPVPSSVNGGTQYGGSNAPAAPVSSAAASSAYSAPASSAYSAPAYSAPASSAAYEAPASSAPAYSAPAYSAPVESAPASYEAPASSAASAETTAAPAAPAGGDPDVVTVTEYVTVTDDVYVTATAPAGYKRHLHEHQKHARHH
ncbi:hypothetical protein B0A48_15002 [Cryoendolithus antarcticus]|uniref:AA9 family lytic polysaccharide monooxygenase n=1 Tax=Cryoendolithus antarcticus TaxID=1507870 RepID=A0A1V8SJA3_9PEZI|nr:hypothetical protein B0A48_15002 [Cryoendolithus antarcticus]